MELATPQKHFGPRSLLVCFLVMNTIMILSIDMYVPALPSLLADFDTTAAILNLTLFLFLLASAIAVLIAGPLCDKFGRKPILLASSLIFTISSLGCALSMSIPILTAFRIGQAIGFGLAATNITALIKDAYSDNSLKFAMSLLQSLVIIGPVLAPFLGTFFLTMAGWRSIFVVLTVLGGVCVLLSVLVTETMPPELRLSSGIGPTMRELATRVKAMLSKRSFCAMTWILGFAGLPYMGFIAVASYILLDDFGTGYVIYNFVYAAICFVSVLAPFLYLQLSKVVASRILTLSCIIVGILAGVLMFLFGYISPLSLFLCFLPYVLMEGIIRPHAFVVLLDQPPEQVSSASSFANFMYSVMGAIGTTIMTLPWVSYISGLAILIFACSFIMLLFFLWGMRRTTA